MGLKGLQDEIGDLQDHPGRDEVRDADTYYVSSLQFFYQVTQNRVLPGLSADYTGYAVFGLSPDLPNKRSY